MTGRLYTMRKDGNSAMPVASQSRTESMIEALVNVAIGFGINLAANLIVLPAFGFAVTLPDALGIGVVFTAISVARSYCVRRWFNGRIVAFARRLANEGRA